MADMAFIIPRLPLDSFEDIPSLHFYISFLLTHLDANLRDCPVDSR